ncbi:MAG TPA: RNA polymerase sigma factor [Planctomycetota bacterium]|nr:RNA polymerase sigma factor [Planctomycetota bacterium]
MSLPRELAAVLDDPEQASRRRDEISTRLMGVYRRTRDPEAYSWLFRLNSVPLGRSLHRTLPRLAPGLDPDDVVQDAFLSVFLYPRRFEIRGERAFRTWMRAIVWNAIRRRLRRDRRPRTPLEGENLDEVLDPGPEPSCDAMDREEGASVRRAFALLLLVYLDAFRALRPRDRARLRLVEVLELDYGSAAHRLGEKRENLKMAVFRARRRLFRSMAGRLGTIPPLGTAGSDG